MSVLKDYPARVATALAAASALAGALAVPLANLDLTSTAGVVAGVVAISGVVSVWLNGQKAHEANQADRESQLEASRRYAAVDPGPPEDFGV